jgi:heat shock protein HslJ
MASIAFVAACGNNGSNDETTAVPEDDGGQSSTEPALSIVGQRWVLAEVQAQGGPVKAPADPEAYLEITEDGDVTGSTGCNGFGGSAEVGDQTITFQPLIATKRGCSGDLGKLDSAMLSVLHGEVTAEVAGGTLTITDEEGEVLTLEASGGSPS